MDFDFPRLIGELNEEELIKFYEHLSHNLTVSVRGVWSDSDLSDGQKVERLKWINEIMHRVVRKSALLRVHDKEFSEEASWNLLKDWVSCCPEIDSTIDGALKSSYGSCRN